MSNKVKKRVSDNSLGEERTSSKDIFKVHLEDARNLEKIVPANLISVTVTSPPYFDLKDYGSEKQIGFGQDYLTYLSDLKNVFSNVHKVTKDDGSLWIIIDTFRRDQEMLPLPFDLAGVLKDVGWSLKDIIIWKKERTLPWVQSGATRNIFEYVLVFSKLGKTHQYFPDRQREVDDLKHWWVRYPERYNPKGKSLEEIWAFDIPTQGSWGTGYVRHFCPLPEGLVQRIIDLTTNPGDVVLDPFSGSGTVPAQALFMKRKYVGFELNSEYIAGFENYIQENLQTKVSEYDVKSKMGSFDEFERKIINLRILKLGRILLKEVQKSLSDREVKVVISRLDKKTSGKFKIVSGIYSFVVNKNHDSDEILNFINELMKKALFSKFGIDASFKITKNSRPISLVIGNDGAFAYTLANSHKYFKKINSIDEITKSAPVISKICMEIDENDYK
jgi:DNA modification methylase